MNIQTLFNPDLTETLAKSLLHSLWQATVIGFIYLLFLRSLSSEKSSMRYNLGLCFLLAILLCWLGTFSVLNRSPITTVQPNIPAPSMQHTSAEPSSIPSFPFPSLETVQPAPAPLSAIETPKPKAKISPHTILILLWSTGVFMMTIRLFFALTGTRHHRKKAIQIKGSALPGRFNSLRELLGINRNILWAATTTLNSPGVIGIIKPMVLIPASMLSGYSASDLEAIVAHELAHIRRHDYLFNLLQMVMESIFFFNPAVWWISHRIRLEREVCCDAEAMRATGQRFEYANLLLNEFGAQPAGAVAFSSNKKEDAKERLMRIIHPHRKFDIKIGVLRLCLLLILTYAVIATLAKTSDLAVDAVTKILTPKERVEQLQKLGNEQIQADKIAKERKRLETVSRINEEKDDKIRVSGIVKTSDGKELPSTFFGRFSDHNEEYSTSGGFRIKNGQFSHEFYRRPDVRIAAFLEGYAPARFKVPASVPGNTIEGVELILKPGFNALLDVVDEAENPIPDVAVQMAHIFPTSFIGGTQIYHPVEGKTDKNGQVEFKHVDEGTIGLNLFKAGYQYLEGYEHAFEQDVPLRIVLKKGFTTSGSVHDYATGLPVPNAEIRLLKRSRNGKGKQYNSPYRLLTQTDEYGAFTISTLQSNEQYTCLITAAGYNGDEITFSPSPDEQVIKLSPEKVIRGQITGNLNRIGKRDINGVYQPVIKYECWIAPRQEKTEGKGQHYTTYYQAEKLDEGYVAVSVDQQGGHFEFAGFRGDILKIELNRELYTEISLNEESEYQTSIDLDSLNQTVELAFNAPADMPAAYGSVQVYYQTKARHEKSFGWHSREVTVTNGVGTLELPTPAVIRLKNATGLGGYSIRNAQKLVDIPHQPAQHQQVYELEETGGMHGKIMLKDGRPVNEAQVKIKVFREHTTPYLKTQKIKKKLVMRHDIQRNVQPSPGQTFNGNFALTSLPIDYPYLYILIANAKHTFILSDPTLLSYETPIKEVDLILKEPDLIEGTVLKPNRDPASNVKVSLNVSIKILKEHNHTHGFSSAGNVITDENGYFRFENVNKDKRISYTLNIDSCEEHAGIRKKVKPGSKATYKLKPKK